MVLAAGGQPPLQYSINNKPQQSHGVFTNVAPGQYTITVKDKTATIQKAVDVTEPSQGDLPRLRD